MTQPRTTLDPRFSDEHAHAVPWSAVSEQLAQADLFWISTVRPDGRPHVTPLLAVWLDDALYFCTGADERKGKNIADNQNCILTTGTNRFNAEGLDVVIEGVAVRLTDGTRLQRIADEYERKYGSDWHFDVRDGAFIGQPGNVALVFEVRPVTAFGFQKGSTFGQTTYRF